MSLLITQNLAPPRSSTKGSSWVEPIYALTPETVPCSAIENLCARVYPSPTLFFKLRPNEDPVQHYRYMCRGLARMLNKYPHLAGNLRPDDRGAFSIEVPPAPQAGSRFYYTDLSGDYTFPSFRELQAGGFPFADGVSDGLSRLRPDPLSAHEDGSLIFMPQLSHVRGGLVLTVSFSHLIGDMVLLQAILDTWAQETCEVATAAAEGRPEAPVPQQIAKNLVDRSRLLPRHDGPATFEELAEPAGQAVPDWKLVDLTDIVTLETMKSIVPAPYIPASQAHATKELRTTISGVWRFPLASLKALHCVVQASSKTGTRLSTADVLTAYLWERIFDAKYLPSISGHAPAHPEIVCAAEVRRRLNPPLPAGYMGACVDLLRCSATPQALTARSTDPNNFSQLAEIATSLRTANGNWSEEKYMALLSLSQRTPISPGFVPRGPIDLLCTDHSRVPSVRVNSWGPGLGCSVAYREPYLGREPPAGEITVLPRCANGDLEVMISAERIVMGRLVDDGDLRVWGEMQFLMHDAVGEKRRRDGRARL